MAVFDVVVAGLIAERVAFVTGRTAARTAAWNILFFKVIEVVVNVSETVKPTCPELSISPCLRLTSALYHERKAFSLEM